MRLPVPSFLRRLAGAAVLAAATVAASAQPAPAGRIVAFGSSLSDTGNAFVWLSDPAHAACGTRLNLPPWDALDDNLTPDGPYARGGHHVTNGATWVEGVARALGRAGDMRPALRTGAGEAANYAVFGARAVAVDCRFNLGDQVGLYTGRVAHTAADTLVALEIGSNDVRDALFAAARGGDPAPILAQAIASLYQQVGMLHAHGARRFLVVNVPDIGRTPALARIERGVPGATALASYLAAQFNLALDGVAAYGRALGSDVRVLDAFTLLDRVVAEPAAYGFTNATDACIDPYAAGFKCAQPALYVFWDGIHPTAAMHAVVAAEALRLLAAP